MKLFLIPFIVFFIPMKNEFSYNEFSYSVSKIDKKLENYMIKHNSYNKKCPVGVKKLRLLKLQYVDFDNNTKIGSLIVHKDVVNDIIFVFKKLYEEKYPIYSMKLVSEFNGNDELSMQNNNTSSFNCRKVMNSRSWSNHSYGKAIDINPLQNPYIRKNKVYPKNASKYKNRNIKHRAIINKKSIVYKTFKKRGWFWGGNWRSVKDYQHFEKK